MIEALAAMRLDPAFPKGNALGDDQAGTALVMVIGEVGDRHRDGETRQARDRRETHLGLHLVAAVIAPRVGKIARELDEQLTMKSRIGALVFNAKEHLVACAAPWAGLQPGDPPYAVLMG